ncbi:phosphotransferase [Mixta tenebrionis]|nr:MULTISPECIES: phosphotransferase [Mixta]QHM74623.1 Stress response kinase A [Mixta theicola]
MNMHDAALIANDSALPGLALLLEPHRLLSRLRACSATGATRDLTINYLRYKPGTSCIVGLTLTLADGRQQLCYAKALTPERFHQSWQHPRRQRLIAAAHPHAPLALRDEAILLQYPEFDFAIRYLNDLIDVKKRPDFLQQLLPGSAEASAFTPRFLRYKPERRAVIALSRHGQPQAVVRIANAREFERILQGCSLGAALGHLSLAGFDRSRRALATHWLAGESLAPETGARLERSTLHAVGGELARLHQTPFLPPVARHGAEEAQTLQDVFNTFRAIYPPGADRFLALTRRISRHLVAGDNHPVLLHGDFSADQIVRTADGDLRFIDWDRSCSGNALADIASFRARLEMQLISGLPDAQQAAEAIDALLDGYLARRSLPAGLAWHSASALLCLATEPFRLRAPDWPQQTEALLARAAQLVEKETEKRLSGGEPVKPQETLAPLVDPGRIAQPLLQALRLPAGSRLQQCLLLRHKPGRRALIEYQLTLPDGTSRPVIGKYRVKGLDRHAFRCQQALWRRGFDAAAAVAVPQPLAALPEWRLWLQEKVHATPLTEWLQPDHPQLAVVGAQVGKALAVLQQSEALLEATAASTWSLEDELKVLQTGLQQIAADYPQWQARLSQLFYACQTLAAALTQALVRPVHRDFYPDQVMIDRRQPQQVVLVDFDLCSRSCAALDAGNYLAHVAELALRRYGATTALDRHAQAFTRAYLAHSAGVSAADIERFTALSLARHIFLSTRFPDRAHTTLPLLEHCERLTGCQPGAAENSR